MTNWKVREEITSSESAVGVRQMSSTYLLDYSSRIIEKEIRVFKMENELIVFGILEVMGESTDTFVGLMLFNRCGSSPRFNGRWKKRDKKGKGLMHNDCLC